VRASLNGLSTPDRTSITDTLTPHSRVESVARAPHGLAARRTGGAGGSGAAGRHRCAVRGSASQTAHNINSLIILVTTGADRGGDGA
jgi:hypothetical protein